MNFEIELRVMNADDWDEVAELICLSTNAWYQSHGLDPIFVNGPGAAKLFCNVYEDLDPGRCILAFNRATKKIVGSCFYHPRPSHVSLGIMNVHPNYFGASVASRLLKHVTDFADECQKPVRLVSSALNLDSFSLYSRMGFEPVQVFQDMFLTVPDAGLPFPAPVSELTIRAADEQDVTLLADLEIAISGISRESDWRYFVENQQGIWHTKVAVDSAENIVGCLGSVFHPGSNMIGPGFAKTESAMLALLYEQLNHHRGRSPVFLVPVSARFMIQALYDWKARNCEIHFLQIRGQGGQAKGIAMPTFMPETA